MSLTSAPCDMLTAPIKKFTLVVVKLTKKVVF